VGLTVVVRCGPWCHGEVRNGGLPDWVLQKGWQVRTDDERYLAKVRVLYAQIAAQLKGLLWKEGGPVVGVQLDNEYGGPAQHLLSLKRLAREAGLDTPLYTRTGWPELATPMPFGEILPLYGNYAEGFWDREIAPMPGKYWEAFLFSNLRTSETIATDLLGQREAQLTQDALRYPTWRARLAAACRPRTTGASCPFRRIPSRWCSCRSARAASCPATTCTTAARTPRAA